MRETDRVVSIVEAVLVAHVYRFCTRLMCIGYISCSDVSVGKRQVKK